MEKQKIKQIVAKHRYEKAALLAVLHEVQSEDRCLGMESLRYIAELLKVPFAVVYGVTTFYSAFSTTKKGATQIRVCGGLSCHINGADQLIKTLQSHLKIEMGETSWDEKCSLEKVSCLGLCAIGPNLALNEKVYPFVDKNEISEILRSLKEDLE